VSAHAGAARHLLLAGGVGGAKLAFGLDRALPPGALTIVANTGDDFRHLGLAISPDLDTLMYTLAGIVDAERGWGLAGETWEFMAALERLGGESWFRLGDRDLATHVERTQRLRAGESLTSVTQALAQRLGLATQLLPMSDAPAGTTVETGAGMLPFQEYFVRRRAVPAVVRFHYGAAPAAGGALAACTDPALAAIFVAPSNPWLSIAPILARPGLRTALGATRVPVIGVSPIVGGAAIKGPTAKIMRELGLPVSPPSVAAYYGDILDGWILDHADAAEAPAIARLGIATHVAATIMRSDADRVALAHEALGFAAALRARGTRP
jgi:LPPG:FO 2-phospho-L-lactate transferase